nr:deaminase [Paenarthrobacter ureafaciens]MCY0975713.1 deaminase [Paenarthrobacter ureafaciens]
MLYTTLSPCPMCTGAMILYGIPKVVIGTPTVREWGEDRLRELGVEVVHTRSEACAELLSRMITQQRELIREDGGNFFAQAGV